MHAPTVGFVLAGHSDFWLQHICEMQFQFMYRNHLVGLGGFGLGSTGDVVLGYDTYWLYQQRGFATQAVGLMCDWVFKQWEVPAIRASANIDNLASQKVLGRNGFSVERQRGKLFYCIRFAQTKSPQK